MSADAHHPPSHALLQGLVQEEGSPGTGAIHGGHGRVQTRRMEVLLRLYQDTLPGKHN